MCLPSRTAPETGANRCVTGMNHGTELWHPFRQTLTISPRFSKTGGQIPPFVAVWCCTPVKCSPHVIARRWLSSGSVSVNKQEWLQLWGNLCNLITQKARVSTKSSCWRLRKVLFKLGVLFYTERACCRSKPDGYHLPSKSLWRFLQRKSLTYCVSHILHIN